MIFQKNKKVNIIAPPEMDGLNNPEYNDYMMNRVSYNLVPLTGVLSLDENPQTVELPAFVEFFIKPAYDEKMLWCQCKSYGFYLDREIANQTVVLCPKCDHVASFQIRKNKETISFNFDKHFTTIFLPLYSIVKCAYPEA